MNKSRNIFIVGTVIFALTTIVGLVGYLSTSSQLDIYKNQSDMLVGEAVDQAIENQIAEDEARFAEEVKKPYTKYVGPSDFGSISFDYPKTWSVYNDQFDENGYGVVFHPGVIPVVNDETAMSLRVSVVNQPYETIIAGYEKQVTEGSLRATVINVAKSDNFAGYEGIRFNGAINENLPNGSIIALKLRDKTILIQTDSADWSKDFKETILPTFRYIE